MMLPNRKTPLQSACCIRSPLWTLYRSYGFSTRFPTCLSVLEQDTCVEEKALLDENTTWCGLCVWLPVNCNVDTLCWFRSYLSSVNSNDQRLQVSQWTLFTWAAINAGFGNELHQHHCVFILWCNFFFLLLFGLLSTWLCFWKSCGTGSGENWDIWQQWRRYSTSPAVRVPYLPQHDHD